jgi:hypothetical protein
MKFIVDEMPYYSDQCPFYNARNGTCRIDSEECERFRKDYYPYRPDAECQNLKVLTEDTK